MVNGHDFKRFPELRNSDLDFYYWKSPHKQIFEDFNAKCVRVIDGDTIKLRWSGRDFDFDLRIAIMNAPELSERSGDVSKDWLIDRIENKQVDILIDPDNRVEKWGRLLGLVYHGGQNIGQLSIDTGHATLFAARDDGTIPPLSRLIPSFKEAIRN